MQHSHSDSHPPASGAKSHSCCGGASSSLQHDQQSSKSARDPVCGMSVDPKSPLSAEHDGAHFVFCSAGCRAKFIADPQKYLNTSELAAHAAHAAAGMTAPAQNASATRYTCPMHPEVVSDQPGTCPKCGMALEPMMPTALDDENPELKDFTRRFWWTLPLTIIVTALAMFAHRFHFLSPTAQSWVELSLSLPIVLWAGMPFFVRGGQSVANRSPNMWTLIGLGTGAAFVYSVAATVAPGVFPETFKSMGRAA